MNLSTKIPIEKSKIPIDYSSKIMSFGSCFSENIGKKLEYFKFQNIVNPFGILFNPVAIENLVFRSINNQKFTEKDIFFNNDLWHCFEVHSELSNPNKEDFLNQLNALVNAFYIQISTLTHCIITYGTAWVYRNKASKKMVANCHKAPQNQFDKEILSVVTIQKSIQNTIDLIHKINPKCYFIFTISPVRHLKDGFIENQRSKAHLITALQNPQFSMHNYFPSYEIMMDELRDYRFYAEDMLHPSQIAIDYIWERFFENYISEENYATMEEIGSIQKALSHRPFNPNSESHRNFLNSLNQKIIKLQNQFPQLQFN